MTGIGILLEMLSSLFEARKRVKVTFIVIGAIVALVGILMGYFDKKNEDERQNSNIEYQKNEIQSLRDSLNKANSVINLVNLNVLRQMFKSDTSNWFLDIINTQNTLILDNTNAVKNNLFTTIKLPNNILKNRSFSEKMENYLTNIFKEVNGSVKISVNKGSDEAMIFASQIEKILNNSGWYVEKRNDLVVNNEDWFDSSNWCLDGQLPNSTRPFPRPISFKESDERVGMEIIVDNEKADKAAIALKYVMEIQNYKFEKIDKYIEDKFCPYPLKLGYDLIIKIYGSLNSAKVVEK